MRVPGLIAILLASSACRAPEQQHGAVHKDGPPAENPAFRQGYTQAPPRGAPGFPPPIAPFLTPEEADRAARLEGNLSAADRRETEAALSEAIRRFDLERLSELAREGARSGRLAYRPVARFHRDYLVPNAEADADAQYKGRFVLLTGRVAPESMLDAADGFKVFEEDPYVRAPVLLETDFELTFVRCNLARPDLQALRDWQEVHILGKVVGKHRSDVILDECVVLPGT
jgi:hypothetical protein